MKMTQNVLLISPLHPDVNIQANEKKTSETVAFYNKTKCWCTRSNVTPLLGKSWPVHTFYNVLDIAGVNAYIIFKVVTNANISRKEYLQKLAEELRSDYLKTRPNTQSRENVEEERSETGAVIRRKCQIRKHCNENKTICKCKKMVCGKCTPKTTYICLDCR